jgi:hypothetical protein
MHGEGMRVVKSEMNRPLGNPSQNFVNNINMNFEVVGCGLCLGKNNLG